MLAHCNLKQNMCLYSKQSSLFSFYALPSGGKCGGSLDASNNIYAFSLNGLFECASLYCKTGQKIDKRQIGRGWPKFLKTVASFTHLTYYLFERFC